MFDHFVGLALKSVNNYSYEFTPTETCIDETCVGDTLLYIVNRLCYKYCNDLNTHKKNELESIFIELVNPKESNIIV